MKQVSAWIARNIKRERDGLMSQAQLAEEMTDLGVPVSREIIANIENGRRDDIAVSEWLAAALALHINPVLLMEPPDGSDPQALGAYGFATPESFIDWLYDTPGLEDEDEPDDEDAWRWMVAVDTPEVQAFAKAVRDLLVAGKPWNQFTVAQLAGSIAAQIDAHVQAAIALDRLGIEPVDPNSPNWDDWRSRHLDPPDDL